MTSGRTRRRTCREDVVGGRGSLRTLKLDLTVGPLITSVTIVDAERHVGHVNYAYVE